MGRYACCLFKKESFFKKKILIDDNCIIGYDESVRTYFFQSGEEDEVGEPLLWLGYEYRQFRSISQLESTLKKHDLSIEIEPGGREELEQFYVRH